MDSGSVEEKSREVELVEAVNGSRREDALRTSEATNRAFESIDQGFTVVEVLYDGGGAPTDLRFLEGNREFEKQTGLKNYAGKKARELVPLIEDHWIKTYARVAETGEPVRFENYSEGFGRWFNVFASRVGGEGSRLVSVAVDDITNRKEAEARLRRSEERQAFLLKLSDALHPLSDPIEIQGTASQLLSEYLRANRVFYGEIDEELGRLRLERDFVREGTPSAAGQHPMEVFAWLRSSPQKFEPAVVKDVRTSPMLPETDRAALAALQAGAFIAVPLIKDAQLVACLCATDALPREWTDDEVELVWHTGERTWAAVERARAEAALRASEEKYHKLFDSIENAILVLEVLYDENGVASDLRFIETNLFFEKQTGLKNHIGKTSSELLPNLEDACIQEYASVAETGESVSFESFSHDFGRWISIFASRVGGEGSRLVNVIFYDITEQKQAEADLRESEERQAYLLNLSDALRPLTDPIEIQEVASRLLGEQLQTDRAFYSDDDEARGLKVVERDFVREGVPSLAGQYPLVNFPFCNNCSIQSQASTVIDNVRTSPIFSDTDRAVVLSTGVSAFICVPLIKCDTKVGSLVVADVEPRVWKPYEVELVKETAERTWSALERARAEAAMRESEERFRLFLENVHEYALVQLDTELRFTSWNPGAERIFGYTSKEALGQPFGLLLTPEDRADHVPCMQIAIFEKTGRNEDARWLINKDGTRIWTRWVTEPIRNKDGQITGLAKVLRDETERLRTEASLRQSEKLAVVGRMASSIAHEINNPLEAVTNLIYLARRGVVSPEVGEFLAQAESELARVSHIATATLHFHRQTTESYRVDIEDILESVLVLHHGRLKSMQITTEQRYSRHPSISCQGDEVRQVIANLVSNAIDAMRNLDARRLIVRVRKAVDPATKEEGIRVMIADSGMGIRESARKHVFEPFFTTKPTTGTGLGLWLSSETVNKHKGTLRFRSRTEGSYRGTVFSLFLKA